MSVSFPIEKKGLDAKPVQAFSPMVWAVLGDPGRTLSKAEAFDFFLFLFVLVCALDVYLVVRSKDMTRRCTCVRIFQLLKALVGGVQIKFLPVNWRLCETL